MKKTFLAAVIILAATQAISPAAPNDPNEPNSFRARGFRNYGRGRFERALINYQKGVQRMVVSPRLVAEANSVWIFPIKAQSEQVKFNFVKYFPRLYGKNNYSSAQTILNNVFCAIIAGQIWSLPISYYSFENPNEYLGPIGGSNPVVESNDTHIELLKADSVDALSEQLKSRGRIVPKADLEIYSKYLNKDYSLLTAWREGNEPNIMMMRRDFQRNMMRRRPSIYIEFPAEKPFYCLTQKPGTQGRLTLTVTGLWQLTGEQNNLMQSEQMIGQDANLPDSMKQSMPEKNIPFTMFSSAMRSTLPQGELNFAQGKVVKNSYVDTIADMPLIRIILLAILALLIISYLSAGISGVLVYRKWKGFAEFGLYNIFTIIAMGIAMTYKKGGVYDTFRQTKWKTRFFLIIFSLLVVGISYALFVWLNKPLSPF